MKRGVTLGGIGLALILAIPPALAQPMGYSAVSGTPIFFPGTGHFYQVWLFNGPMGRTWTWEEAEYFASTRTYQGLQGHLGTITSQEESTFLSDHNQLRFAGLLGAEANVAPLYNWVSGPASEVGTQVTIYGGYLDGSGLPPDCLPVSRLYFANGVYWAVPSWVFRVSTGFRCSPLSDARFLVEYSESVTSQIPVAATVPSDILAWWKGEDSAEDDVSGFGGTLVNGAGFSDGQVNRCLTLDGIDDYVDLGDLDPLEGLGDISIELWIKTSNLTQNALIFSKADGVSFPFQLLCCGGRIGAYLHGTGGVSRFASDITLVSDTWTHVAMVVDNSQAPSAFLKLYIDGVLQSGGSIASGCMTSTNNQNGPGDVMLTNAGRALIGARDDGGSGIGFFFEGSIDELSYYTRALSVEEVRDIFSAGQAGKASTTGIGKESRPLVRLTSYPNPFSRQTEIRFSISAPERYQVDIFSVTGRLVRSMSGFGSAGEISLMWDGRDSRIRDVPPGVYLCRVRTAEQELSGRIVRVN